MESEQIGDVSHTNSVVKIVEMLEKNIYSYRKQRKICWAKLLHFSWFLRVL